MQRSAHSCLRMVKDRPCSPLETVFNWQNNSLKAERHLKREVFAKLGCCQLFAARAGRMPRPAVWIRFSLKAGAITRAPALTCVDMLSPKAEHLISWRRPSNGQSRRSLVSTRWRRSALDNQVRRFRPAEIPEHHLARKDDRAGLTTSLLAQARCRRGLEDSVPAEIVDVAAGRNADAADLRGQRVGEIIAVEVQRGDDVKVRRARQDLLQGDVGNGVLMRRPRRAGLPGFCTVRRPVPLRRIALDEFVTPVAERPRCIS